MYWPIWPSEYQSSSPPIARIAAMTAEIPYHARGTYLAMEGPQFSSLAESKLYRQWGCDVIGMTAMPEAKLARAGAQLIICPDNTIHEVYDQVAGKSGLPWLHIAEEVAREMADGALWRSNAQVAVVHIVQLHMIRHRRRHSSSLFDVAEHIAVAGQPQDLLLCAPGVFREQLFSIVGTIHATEIFQMASGRRLDWRYAVRASS